MNKKFPEISVIIVDWNGYNDTLSCLNSLKKVTYKNLQVIVIDNGSEKDGYLELKNEFPNLKVIRTEFNLGFTGGNNVGIRYALEKGTDFVLLLNNDTIVTPEFVEPLLKVFDRNDKAGIVAPQINYYDEPNKIWTAGGKISKFRGSGFAYSDHYDDGSKKDDKKVTFVSGCCMLIKKEVLEKVGLFDENFFLYVEDADLCCRTIIAGYNIIVSNSSKIFHKISRSTSGNLSQLPLYYVTRNRLYFAKKNFPGVNILTLLYVFITMFFKSIEWAVQGKFSNIFVIKKAFYDFFKGNMGKTNHNIFLDM